VRSMMARALREAGYRVLDAESGAAALELAASRAGRIDILVSDLAMPKMSGRELADRLAEQHPAILVLFVSGYPGEEVERRGLLESGRPFLQKPFAPESLIARVGQLLDTGGGTPSNR
jgi:two-component system, cell cycle sensor histidine kinase and response regulator CckA